MSRGLRVFDTHVHLDQFADPQSAIAEARAAGVVGMIAVGTKNTSNTRVLELAAAWPGYVFPALGLHPSDIGELDRQRLDAEISCIEANISRALAVGEVGLDYHKRTLATASKEAQQDVFRVVLEIARSQEKPVLVHSRYAWTDALRLVAESGVSRAVFHWFTGFSSVLKGIIDSGYYVSATPAVEYHEEHRRAVRAVPLERLLLETDAPVWYGRSDRYQSRPADVVRSLMGAAALREESPEAVADATTRAALALLGLATPIDDEEVTTNGTGR
jgi:TatD DNase family protein